MERQFFIRYTAVNSDALPFPCCGANELAECFDILATAMDDGEIMAVRHNYYPLFGLQFHPESIATEEGGKLIRAF